MKFIRATVNTLLKQTKNRSNYKFNPSVSKTSYHTEVENLLSSIRSGYSFSDLDPIVFKKCTICQSYAPVTLDLELTSKNWMDIWLLKHESHDDHDADSDESSLAHWTGVCANPSGTRCGRFCCNEF
jgi:hypothetical protein